VWQTDGWTDGQNYDSQDRASVAASLSKNRAFPIFTALEPTHSSTSVNILEYQVWYVYVHFKNTQDIQKNLRKRIAHNILGYHLPQVIVIPIPTGCKKVQKCHQLFKISLLLPFPNIPALQLWKLFSKTYKYNLRFHNQHRYPTMKYPTNKHLCQIHIQPCNENTED